MAVNLSFIENDEEFNVSDPQRHVALNGATKVSKMSLTLRHAYCLNAIDLLFRVSFVVIRGSDACILLVCMFTFDKRTTLTYFGFYLNGVFLLWFSVSCSHVLFNVEMILIFLELF